MWITPVDGLQVGGVWTDSWRRGGQTGPRGTRLALPEIHDDPQGDDCDGDVEEQAEIAHGATSLMRYSAACSA